MSRRGSLVAGLCIAVCGLMSSGCINGLKEGFQGGLDAVVSGAIEIVVLEMLLPMVLGTGA